MGLRIDTDGRALRQVDGDAGEGEYRSGWLGYSMKRVYFDLHLSMDVSDIPG